MKISQLIEKLEVMKEQHGDISVLIYEPSFESQTPIDEIVYEEEEDNGVDVNTISLRISF
ncbi:hypothetical protein KKF61_07845 [Patescibacteria group bacterium]|nr:hypothetical protein [Patescibacteria group bacterium]